MPRLDYRRFRGKMPAFYEDIEVCDDDDVDDADADADDNDVDDADDDDDDVDDADGEGDGHVDDCPHIPTAKETRTNRSFQSVQTLQLQ